MRFLAHPHRMRQNQRGDTIVEVLISIAIVSLVLGGAFVATNRSLSTTRDAQERGDALKLVESQLENVKSLASSDPDEVFVATPATFCVVSGSVVPAGGTSCRFNAAGGTPVAGEPQYNIAITKTGNTFTVANTWANVKGGTASVQLAYKVHR